MNKKLFGSIITICLIIIMAVPVFAYSNRCGYEGKCNADTTNCHNGTVYCDRHAAAYAREHSKKYNTKTCGFSGCYSSATTNSKYCSFHTCKSRNCYNKATTGHGYCTTHASKSSGSYNKNSSGAKKKTTYNWYEEMPDCDDYEDYDDFMDDWDGCMPDGSDAEDYWENW